MEKHITQMVNCRVEANNLKEVQFHWRWEGDGGPLHVVFLYNNGYQSGRRNYRGAQLHHQPTHRDRPVKQ